VFLADIESRVAAGVRVSVCKERLAYTCVVLCDMLYKSGDVPEYPVASIIMVGDLVMAGSDNGCVKSRPGRRLLWHVFVVLMVNCRGSTSSRLRLLPSKSVPVNLLATEYYIYVLVHPVCKI
jgi:hypothetical protein